MDVESTRIYPFIKDIPKLCIPMYFETGEMISEGTVEEYATWYVIKGIVETVATDHNGRQVHVDFIGEDDFAGKISHRFDRPFYTDDIAYTPCELLRIPITAFDKLIEDNIEFERYFYHRCILKAYSLYKQALAGRIFSQKQLLAAHICTKAENSIYFVNISEACSASNSSNRNLYNLIYALEKKGLITYRKPKIIFVRDQDGLEELARPVTDFMDNNY